jgi:hypothetical protein
MLLLLVPRPNRTGSTTTDQVRVNTREIKKQCEWNNHACMHGCLALAWPHLLLLLLDSDASPSHYPVQARGAVTVTGRGCCFALLSSSFNFPFCPDQTALASAHPATPPLHNLHTPALRSLHQPSFSPSLMHARFQNFIYLFIYLYIICFIHRKIGSTSSTAFWGVVGARDAPVRLG